MNPPMPSNEIVLITGASGGIGLELARVFAEHGHSLILIARSGDKLRHIQSEIEKKFGVKVFVFVKDLSKQGAADELFSEIKTAELSAAILVNNAGMGLHGAFAEIPREKETAMIQLNITALTELTQLFTEEWLKKKTRGRILNVASTAAFQPGPFMAVYYATKAYVLSFSEALHCELEGTGISVTALCPGPTESGFQETAGIGSHVKLFKYGSMPAKPVALAGYRGVMMGKRLVLPGLHNKITPLGARIFPRGLLLKIVRAIQGLRARP